MRVPSVRSKLFNYEWKSTCAMSGTGDAELASHASCMHNSRVEPPRTGTSSASSEFSRSESTRLTCTLVLGTSVFADGTACTVMA